MAAVTRRQPLVFGAVIALACAECLCWLIAGDVQYDFRGLLTQDGVVIAERTRNAYLVLAWSAVNGCATLAFALRRRSLSTSLFAAVQLGDLVFGLWWSVPRAASIGEIDSADWVFLQPVAAALAGLYALRRRSGFHRDQT